MLSIKYMGKLRRYISSFFRKPVSFNDQLRIEPISRKFGFDRGRPTDPVITS